jgi:predicted nucleotidyltransferase
MIFSSIKIPHKEKIISSIVGVEPNVKKIILFGSRARQDSKNPFCDIDIGVALVDFTDRKDSFSKEALKTAEIIYEKK